MSWFKKIAQIWEAKSPSYYGVGTDLESELAEVYRLTFIYNTIRNKISETGFSMMKRFDNVLNNIKKQLSIVGTNLKNKILKTFENWLSQHAIVNPNQWAAARIETNREYVEEADDFGTFIKGAIDEYKRYSTNNTDNEIFNLIMNNKNMELLQEHLKSYAIEYINSFDESELREIYNVPENIENPYDYVIDQIENNSYSPQDIIAIDDLAFLLEIIKKYPEIDEETAYIFYRDYVFPVWYNFWKEKGIDNTRKRIENVYNEL